MALSAAAVLPFPRQQTVNDGRLKFARPNSAKLSGMKFELYHPRLPTLRRMDMDTVGHKLSTEHSRTTTTCSREDFIKAKSSLWTQKPNRIHCKGVLDRPTVVAMETYKPHGTDYTDNWNNIILSLKAQMSQHKINKEDGTSLQFSGLAVRRRHPNITSSWQFTRATSAHGNQSQHITPKPMPATMYSRYRGTRPFSANPWK